jgi:hypothetical protein
VSRPNETGPPAGGPEDSVTTTDDLQLSGEEYLLALRWRREARERRTAQQRTDARAAVARTLQRPLDDGETARLYRAMVDRENAGRVRWNDKTADWERVRARRKVLRRLRRFMDNRPPTYSQDEILSRFERVRRSSRGWSARCPAHEDRSPSLSITMGGKAWLFHCFAGCTFDEVCAAVGLEAQRLFR